MMKSTKSFEVILLEESELQNLGFIKSNLHPVNEDDFFIFLEYNRLKEGDIPQLGLTIARKREENNIYLICVSSVSHENLYNFKTTKPILIEEVVPTLKNYLKQVRNGQQYKLEEKN